MRTQIGCFFRFLIVTAIAGLSPSTTWESFSSTQSDLPKGGVNLSVGSPLHPKTTSAARMPTGRLHFDFIRTPGAEFFDCYRFFFKLV